MVWKFLNLNVLSPKGLNWVQHLVSRIGLLFKPIDVLFSDSILSPHYFDLVFWPKGEKQLTISLLSQSLVALKR